MAEEPQSIPLPVIDAARRRTVARSRNGPRRAIVLTLVHAAILAHVAHWLATGRTITPIEPSESMETLELGLVNAGAIFFGLAILSTLVFGRFVCGWGCHVVALQDGCAWLLRRVGVRPKPFRSRLLVFVPLILALYMFAWPAIKRWAIVPLAEGWWRTVRSDLRVAVMNPDGFAMHLTTADFWATFPGLMIAAPFLLVCGFACVYFMGSKGFCTYGCPYGGLFGPADRWSVGKIVVDMDRCSGCGHCTAVCTSNVRVHEEIKAYGSVVDPGCMKCMDCVSVCPTDALSYRFGKPSARRKAKGSVARHFDTSVREDLALLAVFGFAFFATRGLYGLVPLLMAMGVAACVTYLAWKAWRVLRDKSVRMPGAQLRFKGRLTKPGWAFLVVALLGAVLLLHSATVNGLEWRSALEARRLGIAKQTVLTSAPALFDDKTIDSTRLILRLDERARRWGLLERPDAMARSALMLLVIGETAEAESLLRRLVERHGESDELIADLGRVVMLDPARTDETLELYEAALAEHPGYWSVREAWSFVMLGRSGAEAVIAEADGALEAMADRPRLAPARARTLLTRSRAESALGRDDDSLATLFRAVEEDPHSAVVRENYAAGLLLMGGNLAGAIEQLESAVREDPRDARLRFQLGRLRLMHGDEAAALEAFEACVTLDPSEHRRAEIVGLLRQAGLGELASEFEDR